MFPHKSDSYAGQEPGRDGFPGRIVQIQTELALYDLIVDTGETRNVAAEHPAVVAELQALAETARKDLGDALTKRTGKGVREPGRLVLEGPRTISHAGERQCGSFASGPHRLARVRRGMSERAARRGSSSTRS